MHDNNYWSLYRGSNNGRSLSFAFFLGLAVRNNTLRFSNYWVMFSLTLRTWNKINQNRRKMTRIEKKLRKREMQPWKHSRESILHLVQASVIQRMRWLAIIQKISQRPSVHNDQMSCNFLLIKQRQRGMSRTRSFSLGERPLIQK